MSFGTLLRLHNHTQPPPPATSLFQLPRLFEKIKKSIKRIRKSFQPRMSKSSARDRNQFVCRPAPRPPRRGVCCKSEVKSAPGPHQTTGRSGAGMRTHAVSKPRHGQRYFYQGNNEEFLNFKHSTLSQRFYCPNHDVSTR